MLEKNYARKVDKLSQNGWVENFWEGWNCPAGEGEGSLNDLRLHQALAQNLFKIPACE